MLLKVVCEVVGQGAWLAAILSFNENGILVVKIKVEDGFKFDFLACWIWSIVATKATRRYFDVKGLVALFTFVPGRYWNRSL